MDEIGSYGGLRQIAIDGRISQQTLGLWGAGKARPTLEMLLRLTYCLERPTAYAALLIPPRKTERSLRRVVPATVPSGRAGYRRFDRAAIEFVLGKVLVEEAPPALSTVARRLGYRRNRLRTAFPALSTAIVRRHEAHSQRVAKQRRADLRIKVRTAMLRLRADGIYPGLDRIAATLRTPRLRLWRAMQQNRCLRGAEPVTLAPRLRERTFAHHRTVLGIVHRVDSKPLSGLVNARSRSV